jgi:hypothetical protein
MDWPITFATTAAALALAVLAGWRGARPPDPHRGPRMVPWRFLMVLAAFGLILMLVHMANLAGLTTGGAERAKP